MTIKTLSLIASLLQQECNSARDAYKKAQDNLDDWVKVCAKSDWDERPEGLTEAVRNAGERLSCAEVALEQFERYEW